MERLRITVFDKAFQRKGWLGNPESVSVSVGFNVVGSAEVTFAADHPRAADILAEGARLVIDLEGLSYPLLSGPVRSVKGTGPNAQAMLTVTVEDDLRLLWRVLGWQVPTSDAGSQSTAEYRTYTGNAESIVKAMVTEQVKNRLGLPVTVAPNQNRGAVIPGGVKVRMHPLAERLFPAVEQAGLGVRCYQSGAGLVFDVYQPATYPRKISEQAGTLRSWEFSTNAPVATRVVGGGGGDARRRVFASRADTALESRFGDVIEVFLDDNGVGADLADLDQAIVDARELVVEELAELREASAEKNAALRAQLNAQANYETANALGNSANHDKALARLADAKADYIDKLEKYDSAVVQHSDAVYALDDNIALRPSVLEAQREALRDKGSELLLESRPTSGLSVELSETPHFRYGVAVSVGDKVTIQAGGTTITDILRNATITWDREGGLSIQPSVGRVENSADAKYAKAIKALWKGLTNQKTR